MKRIILFLVVLLSISAVQAQSFSVNADVAKWLLQTYNVGAEMTVGNRTTMGIEVFGNNKPYFHKDMKTYGVAPELRYYFSGRPMYHHFIGLSALAMTYDVDWKDRSHRGDAVGGGLTFGYVVPLSSRLTLDAHAGLGLVFYHEKTKFTDADRPALHQPNGNDASEAHSDYQILPTKIGITLSYIIR